MASQINNIIFTNVRSLPAPRYTTVGTPWNKKEDTGTFGSWFNIHGLDWPTRSPSLRFSIPPQLIPIDELLTPLVICFLPPWILLI